jgi:hypothetical protein
MLGDVTLTSQMRMAHEYGPLAHVIAALPAAWRPAIVSVRCGAAQCCVELRAPCTSEAALGIGRALTQALEGREIVIKAAKRPMAGYVGAADPQSF